MAWEMLRDLGKELDVVGLLEVGDEEKKEWEGLKVSFW